ncbi:hypothetical protein N9364_00705 [Alphaproteobacteria bacterium]|nr:hypothetical protein [Alphaproteobacteria bacterium]
MRRYFITQHPTFGSHANPIRSKIENSPYFYSWLALTLNDEYVSLCESVSVQQITETDKQINQVYKDFGDVRYDGDKYIAFTKWWTSKVSDTETRGEYLFAEPNTVNKVMLVEERDTAIQSADDESSLLIRIPKALTRRQIDMSIERIFAKEMSFERGRQTRNPTRSNARYSLTNPIKVETYKMAFYVYEHILLANSNDEKVSNYKLAKTVGLKA